jgi:uncharacterized membrane protein
MVRRFRPLYGLLVVALFMGAVLLADLVFDGGPGQRFQRVGPDADGAVHLDISSLAPGDFEFYRFLNAGNQEVRFFVARDRHGKLQVAFDANEICYKLKRGYNPSGDWVVCRKCDKSFRVEEINAGGGGCKPVPLAFTEEGGQLILAESAILTGWRYFR